MACPMLYRKAIQLKKIGAKEHGVGARRKLLKRAVPPDRHINLPPNHLFLNAQRHLPSSFFHSDHSEGLSHGCIV